MTVTPEELDRWDQMCEAATAGPLVVDSVMENTDTEIILGYDVPDAGSPILVAATFQDDHEGPGRISPREARANARLFAESRTAMPKLVENTRRLNAELARVTEIARARMQQIEEMSFANSGKVKP